MFENTHLSVDNVSLLFIEHTVGPYSWTPKDNNCRGLSVSVTHIGTSLCKLEAAPDAWPTSWVTPSALNTSLMQPELCISNHSTLVADAILKVPAASDLPESGVVVHVWKRDHWQQ